MEPPLKRSRQDLDEYITEWLDESNRTGWFDLPYEMRSMILDMIEIEDLIKFSSCSKECGEEAGQSKNYFKEIYLDEDSSSITMRFFDQREDEEEYANRNYSIKFEKSLATASTTTITFSRSGSRASEKTEEVNDTRNEVVLKYLQSFLKRIGANLRVLRINVKSLMRNKIVRHVQIKNLKKLDELTLGPHGAQENKTCPLDMKFVDLEQLLLVKKRLGMDGMKMTFERLTELKTNHIQVSWAGLKPQDLQDYVKMWANGQLHTNFESLTVYASFGHSRPKRPIQIHPGELKFQMFRYNRTHCFTLKPVCESMKHLTAKGYVERYGKSFKFIIEKDDE